MRKFKLLLVGMMTAALAACGGTDGAPGDAGNGGLQVNVKAIDSGNGPSAEDISGIQVFLENSVGTLLDPLDLIKGAEGGWTGSRSKITVGTYSVWAEAKAGSEITFASNRVTVTISKGTTTGVAIMLHQQKDPVEFTPPQIQSVVLDRMMVDQGDPVTITVTATDGEGDLTLSGRHAVLTPPAEPGLFSGTQPFVGGEATITWTAPMVAGPMWFLLTVTDEAGNENEVGITVLVGDDWGTASFEAGFNLAPKIGIRSRVLNDDDGGYLYLWAYATDPDTAGNAPMTAQWEFSCAGTYGAAKGDFPAAPAGTKVEAYGGRYDVMGDARGPCDVTLTVTDNAGASSVFVSHVDTTLVEASEAP